MNVQVYTGGTQIYDSRIPMEQQMPLLSVHIKEGLNKGGTASIVLPPLHPAADAFAAYAVPVEIYRNGALRWRGRPLPGSSDVYGRRTITCEGELCFLQDATCRPYSYTDDPVAIFITLIGVYNAAVEPWKRFEIGIVSVEVADAITLSSKEPEQVFAAVSKLRQKCGGYILFDTAPSGARRINWFKDLPYLCKQKIKLGYNLTNYSSRPDTAAFATRIIPYGDYGEDGKRIQISVDGKDYVEDADAIRYHGVIERSVIYNGVTSTAELETLAKADLAKAVSLPETITLTAVDMSRIDATIDGFAIGQRVEAESAPHKLSGRYDLVELEEDLIQPTIGSATVTRNAVSYVPLSGTLTGALYQQGQQILQKPSQAMLEQAVAAATAWLTNGQGYKVERRDLAGNTVDTLYMDTPDINTAVNVLRIGQSGIGFSNSGINGPYIYAWTIDGRFNTDCIKTGAIESEDGGLCIDLDNSQFSIVSKSSVGSFGDYFTKSVLSKSGLDIWGWDLDSNQFLHGLRFRPGNANTDHDGVRHEARTEIAAPDSDLDLYACIPVGNGRMGVFRIGHSKNIVKIVGHDIDISPSGLMTVMGKRVQWALNNDAKTYSLVGTDIES